VFPNNIEAKNQLFINYFTFITMKFYDLSKKDRDSLVFQINKHIEADFEKGTSKQVIHYFSEEDTYIRKTAYQAIGKIYFSRPELRKKILLLFEKLLSSKDELIRQTTINSAGEIGKFYFEDVRDFFDKGIFDHHHKVRNAVIGSLKKMGERNPIPTLTWAKQYLHHHDKEIRREICHGIELRGRKYPQDILPMLKELQFDDTSRVKNTLIHVLGQISYKKGCLATVVDHLKTWKNKELVEKALDEIVDVHRRYHKFSAISQEEAINYIDNNYR